MIRINLITSILNRRKLSYGPSSAFLTSVSTDDFYSLTAKTAHNQIQKFTDYEGKVVLLVNVASQCGFTSQYAGLEALYKKFKENGFVVLGFPCNQFGAQEPGSMDEINSFCKINYGVSFPIMCKVNVNGNDAHPVYRWLKVNKPGVLGLSSIKWNFEKFLVGRDGKVIDRWSSFTKPEALEEPIKKALNI